MVQISPITHQPSALAQVQHPQILSSAPSSQAATSQMSQILTQMFHSPFSTFFFFVGLLLLLLLVFLAFSVRNHPHRHPKLKKYTRYHFLSFVSIALLFIALPLVVTLSTYKTQTRISAATSPLTITSVAANNSSAKIVFQPVAGAKDYRIYDVTNPQDVKYAGLRHIDLTMPPLGWQGTYKLAMQANGLPQVPLTYSTTATGSQTMDFPNPEIEWNGLGDHQPHILVVEAVDMLGPVPHANLYDDTNSPLVNPLPTGAMLGSNKGLTDDGKTSTNGQGPYTNNPQVIAQSQPFVVQAPASVVPIPARSDATQTFLDTFDQTESTTIHQTAIDANQSTMSYTINSGTPKEWSLLYTHADVKDSMPFIASSHFMDMLFDAGTPGTNNPPHQGHGEMGMTPKQTVDFSGGKILHVTQEVDGHNSGRRWESIALSPANDPFANFDPQSTSGFNTSNQSVFLQFFPGQDTLGISKSLTSGSSLWGAAGQAPIGGYDSSDLGGNGIAFDDRSRYDFFISQTHAALFKDGQLIQQSDIAGGLPFTTAKVYFIHYVYHSDQEENTAERDLLGGGQCYPMNSYWFNDPLKGIPVGNGSNQTSCGVAYPPGFGFRYSDERHWDNMGFEVFPASDAPANKDWSSFASLVQPIAGVAPTFVNATIPPGGNPTAIPTLTSTPTSQPTIIPTTPSGIGGGLTNTPIPHATNIPTPTPTSLPVIANTGSRLSWLGNKWYAQGANVPWFNWQCDFGCNNNGGVMQTKNTLAPTFQTLVNNKAHVVRWWMMEGDPWQITRDSSGMPTGINPAIYPDIDAALLMAQQYDLYYDFVLFSSPTAIPTTWETDPTQRAALVTILGQLFAHYKGNSHILSWEIYNEPEFDIWNNSIAQQPVVDTATAIAQSVHTNAPGTLVTIGNAFADGIPMWKNVGLDFYSPHWYDYMNSGTYCLRCNDYSFYAKQFGITQPIVIGETYSGSDVDTQQRFTDFYNKGYAGAWSWSLFPDHTSDHMAIDQTALVNFANQHTDIGPKSSSPTLTSAPTPTQQLSPTPKPTATPTIFKTPVPTIPLGGQPSPTNVITGQGLIGIYFNNQTLSGTPVFTRADQTINFNWGSGSPDASLPKDHFSVRWIGSVFVPANATYTFYTQSDDGIRLWVNNIRLINNWSNHASSQNSGKITLSGGQRYPIKIEFYENTGQALAKLSWSSSSISKRIIQTTNLLPF